MMKPVNLCFHQIEFASGLMVFQESDYYKEKSKHRSKIEAKDSEMKNAIPGTEPNFGIGAHANAGYMAVFSQPILRELHHYSAIL